MLTEPLYEYKRGEGWIPTLEQSLETTTYDGIKVRLIARVPNVGERYACRGLGWDYDTDGVARLPEFVDINGGGL